MYASVFKKTKTKKKKKNRSTLSLRPFSRQYFHCLQNNVIQMTWLRWKRTQAMPPITHEHTFRNHEVGLLIYATFLENIPFTKKTAWHKLSKKKKKRLNFILLPPTNLIGSLIIVIFFRILDVPEHRGWFDRGEKHQSQPVSPPRCAACPSKEER